jgi:hypothetical protein
VHPSADIETIEDLLLKVSWLVEAVPEIVGLHLNPPAGSRLLDC